MSEPAALNFRRGGYNVGVATPLVPAVGGHLLAG
jgi:hypothetical protein